MCRGRKQAETRLAKSCRVLSERRSKLSGSACRKWTVWGLEINRSVQHVVEHEGRFED